MIIEIIEKGGIYCYKHNDEILYIGKTKKLFIDRDKEHRQAKTPTEFEIILKENKNIILQILYDCSICPLSFEQLDYLETCFITILKPKYNIQKINYSIENVNPLTTQNKIYKQSLTKSENIILTAIKNNLTIEDKFTKKDITNLLQITISAKTLDTALKKFIDLNIIQLLYQNINNENIYQLIL